MSPDCFEEVDSQLICTHKCQHSIKIHTAWAVFITGLDFRLIAFFQFIYAELLGLICKSSGLLFYGLNSFNILS